MLDNIQRKPIGVTVRQSKLINTSSLKKYGVRSKETILETWMLLIQLEILSYPNPNGQTRSI